MKAKKMNWGHVIVYILTMGILITVLPFAWMILTSFKRQGSCAGFLR